MVVIEPGAGQATPRVVKVCGADVELANFFVGGRLDEDLTPGRAAVTLLSHIDGVPSRLATAAPAGCNCLACVERRASGQASLPLPGSDPQDRGRRFLAENGGCAYIDLDHLEICLPEVRSAFDHVASWHAMLRIARRALEAANAVEPAGRRIQVLVNNRDGFGNSYGSHLDFLVTRRAWDNIFGRRMQYLLYLAAYQVSSIVFTGQGKVGCENGRPAAAYQLSQRADFIESLTGPQTTFRRPIVNSRDEALCGGGRNTLARLHAIFFDSTLCHVASLLKVGVMQIVLAMIEAERIDAACVLEDPLDALAAWSRDPALRTRARLASGVEVTAVELQRRFFEGADAFASAGGLDGIVPRAAEILALWDDTLAKLEARDFTALTPRLDWVLKLSLLDRAQEQRPDLAWDAPAIRHLDHLYSSLDPRDGLYWACEASGAVERVVSEETIARFTVEPPEDTRAWTRATLLRLAGRDGVEHVDWDAMRIRQRGRRGPAVTDVDLWHPAEFGKADVERLVGPMGRLGDVLEGLSIKGERHETAGPVH